MAKKPSIPDHHLKEIGEEDRRIFVEYQKTSSANSQFFPKILEFLKYSAYKNNKRIKDLDKSDIEKYFLELIDYDFKVDTINFRRSAIINFRDFLKGRDPKTYPYNFLSEIPKLGVSDVKKGRVLSLIELGMIRKYNRDVSRASVRDTIIFELFFQECFDKKNFPNLQENNITNEELKKLVQVGDAGSFNEGTINYYLTKLTKYLQREGVYLADDRKMTVYDIIESHKAL